MLRIKVSVPEFPSHLFGFPLLENFVIDFVFEDDVKPVRLNSIVLLQG